MDQVQRYLARSALKSGSAATQGGFSRDKEKPRRGDKGKKGKKSMTYRCGFGELNLLLRWWP